MKPRRIIYGLILISMMITGTIFHVSLCNYLWGLSWNKIMSMAVFISGTAYAIIERNFIVGVVSIASALLLPFIQTWLISYWPWFKANYVFFKFR
jgi:hypothetical protein